MKRLAVQFHEQTINMSLPEFGVLSALVCVVDRIEKEPGETDQVRLELGGLDSADGLHPQWGDFYLAAGDSVTITVHDDRISDEPIGRTGQTVEESKESEKNYVRQRALEFGWTISENGG